MKSTLIQTDEVKKAAIVLRALNHELRQKMLYLLDTKNSMNVSDIYLAMRLEQSVCSQHLAILRRAGIVGIKPEGKNRYYYINHPRVEEINGLAKALVANNLV